MVCFLQYQPGTSAPSNLDKKLLPNEASPRKGFVGCSRLHERVLRGLYYDWRITVIAGSDRTDNALGGGNLRKMELLGWWASLLSNYNKNHRLNLTRVLSGIFVKFLTQLKLQQEDIDFLKSKIDEDCTQTLEKLRDRLHLERGKKVSVTTVAAEIKGFKYSLKRVVPIPNAAESEALWAERKEFTPWFLQSNQRKRMSELYRVGGVRLTIQQQAIIDEPELAKRYDRLAGDCWA
eukprot:gene9352-10155_t